MAAVKTDGHLAPRFGSRMRFSTNRGVSPLDTRCRVFADVSRQFGGYFLQFLQVLRKNYSEFLTISPGSASEVAAWAGRGSRESSGRPDPGCLSITVVNDKGRYHSLT
jgi:hypothetical protein